MHMRGRRRALSRFQATIAAETRRGTPDESLLEGLVALWVTVRVTRTATTAA